MRDRGQVGQDLAVGAVRPLDAVPPGGSVDQVARVSDTIAEPRAAALLDGSSLLDAQAWGKQLFVEFPDERYVHVHLGLYGTFTEAPVPMDPPVGQVRVRLAAPTTVADLQRVAQTYLQPDKASAAVISHKAAWDAVGLEHFEVNQV